MVCIRGPYVTARLLHPVDMVIIINSNAVYPSSEHCPSACRSVQKFDYPHKLLYLSRLLIDRE
jgi:hypothetical protein